MKTVMKKMFSLLLVAVMLIGVMPFAAFADDAATPLPVDTTTSVFVKVIAKSGAEPFATFNIDVDTNGDWKAVITNRAKLDNPTYEFKAISDSIVENVVYVRMHPKCDNSTDCPAYDGEHSATCLSKCTNDTSCTNGAHIPTCTAGCDGTAECKGTNKHLDTCVRQHKCTYCGVTGHLESDCPNLCEYCTTPTAKGPNHVHCDLCKGLNGAHEDDCDKNPYKQKTCTKCNNTYRDIDGTHVCCDRCKELHATADCPYCSVCWPKDKVTTHKASDHCEKCKSLDHDTADHCTECGKTDGTHKSDCSHYVSSGTSKVKIYVNLYTGDVLTKTEPLVVYNEDPNTSISDSIAEHKDLIYAELEDQYSGYEWSGNVYDSENEDGENMNSKVGKGINVHINAHSKENIVYLYVHNARTYDRIGIVRLHGKKVGEAVKESEVRKAVKDYFSFSSLKMYDTEKWDLYVDGKDVKSDDTLTVGSNHYVIDVKISGSAKNTSGAKADSSNPKTGDAIFAPAAVLGLSATTLAVLFYLNKKRAY